MTYTEASQIAVAICHALQPHCELINIAGSIRRRKAEVKDIEVVCVPKGVRLGLFEDGERVPHEGFNIAVRKLGQVLKGRPSGRYMQIALPQGVNLDLFMPEPADYYRQYVIRTGSADYVARVIAGGWKRLGWCGTPDGLRRQNDCTEKKSEDGKSTWTVTTKRPTLPAVWQSEQDFFNFLKVPYTRPEDRQ